MIRRLSNKLTSLLGYFILREAGNPVGSGPGTGDAEGPPSFSLTVEYLTTHHAVKIVACGVLTLEANNQIVAAALSASSQYGTHRVLVDDRNITLAMSFVNVGGLSQHNEQLGVRRHLRVAVLYKPSGEMQRIFNYYENCSVINDFRHYVFTDEQAALQWLTEQ